MTHHTDTELLPCPFCGAHAETDFIPEHHSYAIECHSIGCAARVIKETAEDAVEAWNRRAPAAPVPQETCVICGSNEPYTGTCGSNDPRALCKKPAPQPPEAAQLDDTNVADMAQAVDSKEAAPVQLPEPVAYLHECGKKPSLRTLEFSKVAIQLSAKGYKSLPLYTEQQVRELLAAHGIEVAP